MNITTPSALQGLRVIEMGQLIAGPFAGRTLGEFGADVIKIEAPGAGDPLRNWRMIKDGTSVWWQVQSRNKRSIALDLRSAEGQDIARKLITEADVLIENFRPGTLEGWGMGYQALSSASSRRPMRMSIVPRYAARSIFAAARARIACPIQSAVTA